MPASIVPNRLAAWWCRIVGHKVRSSHELKRSPHTTHTHTRDVRCARCGLFMGEINEYHDARYEPDLFLWDDK